MKRVSSFILLIILLFTASTIAKDFSGRYMVQSDGGIIYLTLNHNGKGHYSGTLNGNNAMFHLSGSLNNKVLSGTIGDELDGIHFQATLNEEEIRLTMFEVDHNNRPLPETTQQLSFRKTGDIATDPNANQDKAIRISINYQRLSASQVNDLRKTYGIEPKPGDYWYDSNSGLYGVVGYPAYGFMYPGHDFGTLNRGASAGNTNVLVNGRELPQQEWAVWSYMIGYWIQPGSYWLDKNGNAGYQGNPLPVINLYAAAKQNAYRGRGGSGDNFWSSRFSAGNYDSGNQRGYVSVPGYGPVGYGF